MIKQQSIDQSFLLLAGVLADMLRVLGKLATALLTQIVLFATVSVTIAFNRLQTTLGTKTVVHESDSL